jgi:hypothetical protein
MDVHSDTVIPTASEQTPPLRVDAGSADRDDSVAQLRARLLRLIVDSEKARRQSPTDPSKPR